MFSSMMLGVFSWIGEFFGELLNFFPKLIYLLYSSFACLLDVLQMFFRKLAGLDVYYVNGVKVTGDLVTNFISGILGISFNANDTINYSSLSTIFYSFLLFGVIICFVSVFVAVIKSNYSYDSKKPAMSYVYAGGKALINMVVVPLVVALGLFVSQALLTAIDSFTSVTSSDIVALYGSDALTELRSDVKTSSGDTSYIFYDFFGFSSGIVYSTEDTDIESVSSTSLGLVASTQQTFSGSLFRAAAYNANRVRGGSLSLSGEYSNFTGRNSDTANPDGTTSGLFKNATTTDELAEMIDTAFACNLHYSTTKKIDYTDWGGKISTKYFTNWFISSMSAFSKFNIGAVWYYYNLWEYNFVMAIGMVIISLYTFLFIIFGLMQRLILSVILFLIMPAAYGLSPLDNGEMAKRWREQFLKQVLMAYSSVIGINLVLMLLPYLNQISFFNIGLVDYIINALYVIVALISVKSLINTLSTVIGSASAYDAGESVGKDVGKVAGKAVKMTAGAAAMVGHGVAAIGHGMEAADRTRRAHNSQKAYNATAAGQIDKFDAQSDLFEKYGGTEMTWADKRAFKKEAKAAGLSKQQIKEMQATMDANVGRSSEDVMLDYAVSSSDSDYLYWKNEEDAGRLAENGPERAAYADAARGQRLHLERDRKAQAKSLQRLGRSSVKTFTGLGKVAAGTVTGNDVVDSFTKSLGIGTAEERAAERRKQRQQRKNNSGGGNP